MVQELLKRPGYLVFNFDLKNPVFHRKLLIVEGNQGISGVGK